MCNYDNESQKWFYIQNNAEENKQLKRWEGEGGKKKII